MHIKRILIAVFVILLIFAGCHPRKKTGAMGEVRAAWISYIELSSILDNRSEADYIQGVKTMLENLKDNAEEITGFSNGLVKEVM